MSSKLSFALPLSSLLIVVGGMMLYYREPVMYAVVIPIYILSEFPEFLLETRTFNVMTIIRVVMFTVLVFMAMGSKLFARQYAELPDEFKTDLIPERARHVFPLYGLALGIAAWVGSFVGALALTYIPEGTQHAIWMSFLSSSVNLIGILAFVICLASLWHSFPRKVFSVIGLLLGGALVVPWLISVIQRFQALQ